MNRYVRNAFFSGTLVLSSVAALFAAPEISVDSANFDMGIINEGSQTSVKHTFKIKNTGNETLKIDRVKPSCGCTAVGHDSVIAPGKEGNVTAEVKLTGFRPGKLHKYVTVYSNAKKTPELALSIICNLRAELNIEPQYLHLVADKSGNVTQTFTIVTNKADLVVSDVKFKEDAKNGDQGVAWQNDLPITFSHTLTKTANVHPDGFVEYTLATSLTLPANSATNMYGKFNIATNHPKKSSIELSATIETPKER